MREPVVIEYVLEAGREIPSAAGLFRDHYLDVGLQEILSSDVPGESGTRRVARISVEGVRVHVHHYSRAIDTMFQTVTNVQTGEAVPLLETIDNRCGKLRVGLRSITYTVGWHNVEPGEAFSWREVGGSTNTVSIPPGLYGVERLQEIIEESTNAVDISLLVSKENGLINLTVGGNCEVLFTDGLLSLLGLHDGLGGEWLGVGIYTGDRPVNFVRSKLLRVHLEQVSTTDNALDGAPSTLLTTIGVECHAFGEIRTVRIEHAEFKRLQAGTISELKVSVRDDTGLQVMNHLPISVTLEIVQA